MGRDDLELRDPPLWSGVDHDHPVVAVLAIHRNRSLNLGEPGAPGNQAAVKVLRGLLPNFQIQLHSVKQGDLTADAVRPRARDAQVATADRNDPAHVGDGVRVEQPVEACWREIERPAPAHLLQERAQAGGETSLLKGSARFQPVDGGSGGGSSLGGQPERQRQANDRRDERSTRHRPLLAHFVLARVFGSPSLPEEHAGVADDAVGVAAGVRAGAVADGPARVQQIEPAQRVQHDERRQQTAHADLVLQRRLIHLGRIEAFERTQGDRIETTILRLARVVIQVGCKSLPRPRQPPTCPRLKSSAARYPRDGWWIEWPCTRHSGGLPPSTQRSKFHTQGVFNEPLSGSTVSRRPCGRWPKGCSGARKGAHPRPPAQSIRSGSPRFPRRVRHVTAFVLVALLCAAASVVHAEPVCSSDGWCWSNPLPQGNPLTSVWGSASTDVWAVGYGGTILHWDGSAWSGFPSGTPNSLYGVG